MRVTLDNPTASELFAKSGPGVQPEIPHCIAAANGSWCDLETLETDDEDTGEEFDEEDFDDDFDDDFEDEEDDGYGDFDDTIDPFATDDDASEKDDEDVEFDE